MRELTNIEFFVDPHGNVMVADDNGIHTYQPEDTRLTAALFARIEDEYPEAFKALSSLYAKSRANAPFFQYRVVHRFVRCNFGAYDSRVDIGSDGRFALEEVQCPLRCECMHAGVICGARYNTHLTERQREVMRLYMAGLDHGEVAERLFISPDTAKNTKRNAFRKAGVHSLAEFITKFNNQI